MSQLTLTKLDLNECSFTGKYYYLCRVSLTAMRDFFIEHYATKYHITDFKQFDSRHQQHELEVKRERNPNITYINEHDNNEAQNGRVGVEQNFLVIQARSFQIQDKEIIVSDAFLIDGFKRLFFVTKDSYVYVKVFIDDLQHKDYMQLFHNANYWKQLADGSSLFFDRGFVMFLYVKYSVKISFDAKDYDLPSHMELLHKYLADSRYEAERTASVKPSVDMLMNDIFIHDLKLIDTLVQNVSQLELVNKKKESFVEQFTYMLGQARQKGDTKQYTYADFEDYTFADKHKKQVEKIEKMSWTVSHLYKLREFYAPFFNFEVQKPKYGKSGYDLSFLKETKTEDKSDAN